MKYHLDSLPTPPIGSSASSVNLIGPKFVAQGQSIADQVIEEVDEQSTVHSIRGQEKRPTAQSIFESSNEKPIPLRSAPIDMPASHHNNDTKISYERILSVMPDHEPYLNDKVFSTSAPGENTLHIPSPTVNFANANGDASTHASPGPTSKDGKKPANFVMTVRFLIKILTLFFWLLFIFIAEEDVDCTTPTNIMTSDDSFEQLRLARERERIERQKQKIARSVSQQTGGNIALDSELLLEQLINSKGDGINRTSFTDSNT